MKAQLSPSSLALAAACALLAPFLAAVPALAAPQILAVAATDMKTPVTCDGGECTAELTTICLQEHRGSPSVGTAYYVHGDTPLTLTGTTPAGQEISLAHLDMKITAARGHNAIRVAFRETELDKYGPLALQISVPENISVVPVPIAYDLKPQSEDDIALATGPLRVLASSMVDKDTGKRAAAELVNQAINRLPWRGRASDASRAVVKAAYSEVVRNSGFSSDAKASADAVVEQCYDRTAAGSLSFRGCLGSWHDRLIGKLNTDYWNAAGAGS
jgi:hypothetical protein